MYFVKFEDIAVLVKESGKLVSSPWKLSHEIFELDEDVNFKKLSRKNPFANCKRVDYFDPNKKDAIPRYIMDYILDLPEVKAIMIAKDRDNKIDEILN
jgi:hypothetical protein